MKETTFDKEKFINSIKTQTERFNRYINVCDTLLDNAEFAYEEPLVFHIHDLPVTSHKYIFNMAVEPAYITSLYDCKIVDFNIIVPKKVVEVIFADNTKIKMVLHEGDTFNIESLCEKAILKKIFDKEYYKLIKTGTKAYAEHFEREIEEKAEQERVAKKKEKLAIKRAKREEKIKEREKEKWVDIMTESIKRATSEIN